MCRWACSTATLGPGHTPRASIVFRLGSQNRPAGWAGGVQGGTLTSEAMWSPPGRESPRERSVSRTPGGVGGQAPGSARWRAFSTLAEATTSLGPPPPASQAPPPERGRTLGLRWLAVLGLAVGTTFLGPPPPASQAPPPGRGRTLGLRWLAVLTWAEGAPLHPQDLREQPQPSRPVRERSEPRTGPTRPSE